MSNRTPRARALRQEMPKAEVTLWKLLRGGALDGWKFRRQVPIDRYFADFLCVKGKLVVELDGEHHLRQQAYDDERTAMMERLGYRVIRFRNGQVLDDSAAVCDVIRRELART